MSAKATAVAALTNNADHVLAKHGELSTTAVRTVTYAVVVDPNVAIPFLPRAVVEQLGLPTHGRAIIHVGSERIPSDVVGDVSIEVFGRSHVTSAVVIPDDRPATVGMVFLQSLDLVVDGEPPTLRPRDPEMILTEIE